MDSSPCRAPDCEKQASTAGLCSAHYQRLRKRGTLDKIGRTHLRVAPADRFWSKVDKNGPIPEHRPELGPCWNWLGSKHHTGYGYFYLGEIDGVRRHGLAHRFSYELQYGAIPVDLEIDHLCRNRSCVNPSHAETVTRVENVRRGKSPSTLTAATGVCRQGHEMSADNVYVFPGDGGRRCRKCMRNRQNEWNERQRQKKRAAA